MPSPVPNGARTLPFHWSGSTTCCRRRRSESAFWAPDRRPEEVARFLSGASPTTIVSPPAAKTFELTVQVPVPDMANLTNNSIWPDVEARLVDLVETHNSTIVFANSRRLAERLTARLNEIHAERSDEDEVGHQAPPSTTNPMVAGGAPAHLLGSGQTYGAPTILARA